jgi:iron complex outermembrane recepter protein
MPNNRAKWRTAANDWLLKSSLLIPLAIAPVMSQAQDAAAEADASEEETTETVIVTGTRASGVDAFSSSSPIQVLTAESIENAGRPDLMNALANVVPSFTAQAFGGDMANQTLQAKLRGLSPNHSLVLINGKRRHTTASLAILGGPYQGGAGVDLNFIPVDAIDHVEVLTEGAAAQYGTDAIAGVINIIMKKEPSGGSLSATSGAHYAGDGETSAFSGNIGFEALGGSYLNFTAEYREHEHTSRGEIDPRVVDEARLATFPNSNMALAAGYPYLNQIFGDAAYEIKLLTLNAGIPIGDSTEIYSIASWGDKHAASFENYRLPSRVAYTPEDGETVYFRPFGFSPREETEETDFSIGTGIKGEAGKWDWDLSSTYGKDEIDMFTRDSANASLFAETGQTPTDFYDGTYSQIQWTSNLDIKREIDVGMAGPMNLAFGAEYREETWEAEPGDAASRYLEGGQSFPGISLSDSGKHERDVMGAYVDVVIKPLEALTIDVAGRYEDYSDFGDTTVAKLSTRYELNDAWALRGTASTGFRAPTLAEAYYSATNVGPTTAFVQMPPNAPATAILGLGAGLQPEKSTNFSMGFVFRPGREMSLTFDLYQVEVRNRIAATSTFYGTIDGELYSQVIVDAIIANGNVLDPEVTASGDTGINLFTNGVTTRTRGAELTFSKLSEFNGFSVNWTAAANYNKTEVTKVRATPEEFGTTQSLFDQEALADLETTMPRYLVNLGATLEWERLSLSVHELFYGEASDFDNEPGVQYFKNTVDAAAITNLEVIFDATDTLTLALGATNVFDEMPNKRNAEHRAIQFSNGDNSAVAQYPAFSPFGINGAYYYGKLTFKF